MVALEGGYNADAISAAAVQCMHSLLGDPLPPLATTGLSPVSKRGSKKVQRRRQFESALKKAMRAQAPYWQCMRSATKYSTPKKKSGGKASSADSSNSSAASPSEHQGSEEQGRMCGGSKTDVVTTTTDILCNCTGDSHKFRQQLKP